MKVTVTLDNGTTHTVERRLDEEFMLRCLVDFRGSPQEFLGQNARELAGEAVMAMAAELQTIRDKTTVADVTQAILDADKKGFAAPRLGYRYKTRSGEIVGPMVFHSNPSYLPKYPFASDDGDTRVGRSWAPTGKFDLDLGGHNLDLVEELPKEFRLETGKRYRGRNGCITTPLVAHDTFTFVIGCWQDSTTGAVTWRRNGRYCDRQDVDHPFDLLEEVAE